jgi:hypothetical protein
VWVDGRLGDSPPTEASLDLDNWLTPIWTTSASATAFEVWTSFLSGSVGFAILEGIRRKHGVVMAVLDFGFFICALYTYPMLRFRPAVSLSPAAVDGPLHYILDSATRHLQRTCSWFWI